MSQPGEESLKGTITSDHNRSRGEGGGRGGRGRGGRGRSSGRRPSSRGGGGDGGRRGGGASGRSAFHPNNNNNNTSSVTTTTSPPPDSSSSASNPSPPHRGEGRGVSGAGGRPSGSNRDNNNNSHRGGGGGGRSSSGRSFRGGGGDHRSGGGRGGGRGLGGGRGRGRGRRGGGGGRSSSSSSSFRDDGGTSHEDESTSHIVAADAVETQEHGNDDAAESTRNATAVSRHPPPATSATTTNPPTNQQQQHNKNKNSSNQETKTTSNSATARTTTTTTTPRTAEDSLAAATASTAERRGAKTNHHHRNSNNKNNNHHHRESKDTHHVPPDHPNSPGRDREQSAPELKNPPATEEPEPAAATETTAVHHNGHRSAAVAHPPRGGGGGRGRGRSPLGGRSGGGRSRGRGGRGTGRASSSGRGRGGRIGGGRNRRDHRGRGNDHDGNANDNDNDNDKEESSKNSLVSEDQEWNHNSAKHTGADTEPELAVEEATEEPPPRHLQDDSSEAKVMSQENAQTKKEEDITTEESPPPTTTATEEKPGGNSESNTTTTTLLVNHSTNGEGGNQTEDHCRNDIAAPPPPMTDSMEPLPSMTTSSEAKPTAPAANKHGKFLILSRGSGSKGPVITGTTNDHTSLLNHNNTNSSSTINQGLETTAAEESAAAAVRSKKKPNKPKKKTKKPPSDTADGGDSSSDHLPPLSSSEEVVESAIPLLLSTTGALEALPAQEVSITAETAVKIRTVDMATTQEKTQTLLAKKAASLNEKILKKNSNSISANINTKSKKKKKGLSNDAEANRKAVQQFNRLVHQCVLQSAPDTMREILHNPRNHNFALDATVLETVMKAYVMAAMFEDALYCLRHCTLPGTLDCAQTEHVLSCLPQNLRNSSAYTAADMINALCIATAFDSPTSRTYFLRIVRGIALEFLEEATSARDRICSSPCERLVRAGLCVVNAHLKRGKKPADLLVNPGDQLGVFVPDTMENRGIQAGDAVSILPYAGPYPMSAESLDRNMIEATVTNTNPMVLRLQDKANASLYAMLTEPQDGNVYRIDKLANRMGFNRQLAAAVAIAAPIGDTSLRDPRRPSPELIRAITAMDENIDLVMRASQGNLPRGELTSTAALCAQAIPWKAEDESEDMDQDAIRSECRLTLEKYGSLEGLNGSQMLAVEGATSNRLTLVQGPPGTGKTLAATRILQHWARLTAAAAAKGETPPPILATSDSNIAVDNLVEGCAGVGLRVIRLGRPEAIRPELLRYCIDRPPSSYNNNESGNNNNNNNNNGVHGGGSSSMGHRERLKQIRTDIKTAQVICCTCIGSGGDILDGMTFDRVLVDEATQATEPAVLVPLMRGCRQLVLVGDHCQLPPTVLSTRAEEEGHGVPLFSRMVACGVPPFMLDTQYRMHPRIAMFPSDLFYGGLLKNGVSAPERRPLAGFPWPVEEFPVAFIPIKGTEMDDGVSKYNEDEAVAACNAVAMLMAGGQCRVSDIAVVTPYAAQAKLIRRMTRRLQETTGPPYIEVSSVDGFQGREKEAVVFSAVRSNDYGAIGFTSDWRRVNVSFTRARRGLIVIGNDVTLRRGDPETWGPWLAWADAYGLNVDKPGVPRGRYDPEQLRRVRGGTTAAEMLKDVLQRQHAQLKSAEKQQERAEKHAMGHIRATSESQGEDVKTDDKTLSLEEDIAQLENADGHWDDSDEEEQESGNNKDGLLSKMNANQSSHDSNGTDTDSNGILDVWDL